MCVTLSLDRGYAKAVSDKFISAATFFIVSSGSASFNTQTAAGFPEYGEPVNESTIQMGHWHSKAICCSWSARGIGEHSRSNPITPFDRECGGREEGRG